MSFKESKLFPGESIRDLGPNIDSETEQMYDDMPIKGVTERLEVLEHKIFQKTNNILLASFSLVGLVMLMGYVCISLVLPKSQTDKTAVKEVKLSSERTVPGKISMMTGLPADSAETKSEENTSRAVQVLYQEAEKELAGPEPSVMRLMDVLDKLELENSRLKNAQNFYLQARIYHALVLENYANRNFLSEHFQSAKNCLEQALESSPNEFSYRLEYFTSCYFDYCFNITGKEYTYSDLKFRLYDARSYRKNEIDEMNFLKMRIFIAQEFGKNPKKWEDELKKLSQK